MKMRDFRQKVVEQRKLLGLSQQELAQRAGISRNYVSMIERGVAENISAKIVAKLALAVGLPVGGIDEIIQDAADFKVDEGLNWEEIVQSNNDVKVNRVRDVRDNRLDEYYKLLNAGNGLLSRELRGIHSLIESRVEVSEEILRRLVEVLRTIYKDVEDRKATLPDLTLVHLKGALMLADIYEGSMSEK